MSQDLGSKSAITYPREKGIEKKSQENQVDPNQKSKCSLKMKIIIITCVSLAVVAALIVVLVVIFKKKENYPYEITALYQTEKDKEAVIFNPSRVGLTDEDYKIEYVSGVQKSRRLLKENKITDGRFMATETVLIKVVIKIKIKLTNLNFLFQGSENVINVDFSKLKMEGIKNMMYLFAGCTNLEKVDFTSLDTSKVEYMEFIFGLCTKLEKIDGIEYFDTSSVKNAAGMFYSCENLPSLNLSSFNLGGVNAQQGMFAKANSLQLLDIRNLNNTNNMFGSPLTTINKLKVVLNDDADRTDINQYKNFEVTTEIDIEININIDCIPGNGCQKCSYNLTDEGKKEFYCEQCKSGYYLPESTDFGKFNCKKCDEGCDSCFAGYNNSICISCKYGYKLNNSNFDKERGYYSGTCVKDCAGTNCKECFYEGDEVFCINCQEGYVFKSGQCYKNCDMIKKEGCEACTDNDEVNPPFCTSCKDGYFPFGNPTTCNKCTLEGCKRCQNNICTECENDGTSVIVGNKIVSCYNTCERGKDEKCLSCAEKEGDCASCNQGYVLFKGTCNNCAFLATYETTSKNQKVELFLQIPIGSMKVDGIEVENPSNIYTFPEPGLHEVCVKFDKVPMISNLFANNLNVVSISFSPTFDTSKLTFVNGAFQSCPNLKYIDFSKLDLRNTHCIHYWFQYDVKLETVIFPSSYKITPYFLDYTFRGCISLTSIDLSSFELSDVYDLTEMFSGCTKLKHIDISNFDHPEKKYQVRDMFKDLSSEMKIRYNSEQLPDDIKWQIPYTWTKIEDE